MRVLVIFWPFVHWIFFSLFSTEKSMYDQQCLSMLKDNKNKGSWNLTSKFSKKCHQLPLSLKLIAGCDGAAQFLGLSLTSLHWALSHFRSPSWHKTVFLLRLAFCWCRTKDQSQWNDTQRNRWRTGLHTSVNFQHKGNLPESTRLHILGFMLHHIHPEWALCGEEQDTHNIIEERTDVSLRKY